MSSCAVRRWGPGTTCERPPQTAASQELDKKLKERLAERDRQLDFWSTAPAPAKQQEKLPASESKTPVSESKTPVPESKTPAQQHRYGN